MFSKLAFFAAVASAQLHAPVGEPSGNPIYRPLNEIVPACKAFTITWEPTTPNTVSILLLRGPSSNVVPIGAPIVEGLANSGTFTWTPSAELEADVSRYGLQLIDDVTGQYQWSTQFGISTDACAAETPEQKPEETPEVKPEETPQGYPTYPTYPTETPEAPKPKPSETKDEHKPVESKYPVHSSAPAQSPVPTGAHPSSGYPHASLIVQPTKAPSVPASLKTTATETAPTSTATAPPEFTGAAAHVQAGMGLAAVAGLALLL